MNFPEGLYGFEFDTEYSVSHNDFGIIRINSNSNPETGFWLIDRLTLAEILKRQKYTIEGNHEFNLEGEYFILTNPKNNKLSVNMKAPIFLENDGNFYQRILPSKELSVRQSISIF